jgi:hypothetical protein
MALNLTGIFGDVSSLASSVSLQDIISQAAIGTAVTVAVAGAKSADGQDALDPLQWFHHKPASGAAPVTGVVQGQVMTMSKFLALTPDQQKMIQTMGYTVIPG